MCDSPQDVYAKCLPSNRGYPLWFPEPSNTLPSSYRQDGLQIGDVGYVDWDGAFNVLFNISYGPHHALHDKRRLGVVFDFEPIQLDIDYDVDVKLNADPPGCIITSPGVTQPTKTAQEAGHYEFTPSSAKGAILILPDGATSHKLQLQANERLRKVAIEHAFDWYEFAKEHCGEGISNDSLYLITGFHKARSWSLASFHSATGTEDRRIWVVPREGECTRRDWRRTFPLECRDGPQCGNVNQTVYIRGFKIAVRDDVLGWLSQKPEVQPVPAVRPRKAPCSLGRFLRKFSRNKSSRTRRGKYGSVDVNHVPALSQPFHPSDVINQYLLNKDPNALVAITHDDEWITLTETGKLTLQELSQGDRFEQFLSDNYSVVSQPENGTVYLRGKSEDVNDSVSVDACICSRTEAGVRHQALSDSEEVWSIGPSSDNVQLCVKCIRAADAIAGFSRMPVGFYILVQFDAMKWRTQNKPARLNDSIVEWDDRIQLPTGRSAQVQLSLCASFEFSPMLGNGEVLRTVHICIGDLVENNHFITFATTEGEPISPCSSLHIAIERRPSIKPGRALDPDEHFDWEHSSELARLTDQGHDALFRYRTNLSEETLTVSIEYFERALAICPPNNHCYPAVLCNLATAYFLNYQTDCGSMKLSTSISYYRQALELRPDGHPDRPATLLHLAEILMYQYGKLGFEEYPGEVVQLASEVQNSCSRDSHERRAADLVLQTYSLYKSINSGSMIDIDELIPVLREGVQETPPDYFDKLQRLTNLTLTLWIRYQFSGERNYLNASIATHEEAIQIVPCGLHAQTHAQLLKEKEQPALARDSWQVALATASSFVVSRFSIYRILCERLETVGRVIEAVECFHAMKNEMARGIQDEEAKWIAAFKSCCYGKLEDLGDIAMSALQYDEAISRYSVALSLDPGTPQAVFIKRNKAYVAKGLWEEALSDANEIITLYPSSPWSYERKYVALHKAGNYDDSVDAYTTMLSMLAESVDPDIHRRCDQYINATICRLENRAQETSSFEPPEDSRNFIVKLGVQQSGRFSDVYRCLYNGSKGRKEVAVKVFRFSFQGDASEIVRREFGIWMKLQHPNIVPFLGTATGFGVSGIGFPVSVWMRNGTLQTFLEKYQTLQVDHRLRLLLDIANGLHYLHSFTLPSSIPNPILHGNLYPANVLLDDDFTACLVDFGSASFLGEMLEAPSYKNLAKQQDTLRWKAPEQVISPSKVVPTTEGDVYSFGCIAIQVLSGRPPWSELDGMDVVLQLRRNSIPDRPESLPIDDRYWELIERCLSQVPDRPTVDTLVSSIKQFLQSLPPSRPLRNIIYPSKKRALLIAIRHVHRKAGSKFGNLIDLHLAHRDAKALHDFLIVSHGYHAYDITLMVDDKHHPKHLWPTRDRILHQIDVLTRDAPEDCHFFFYFSGHGLQEDAGDCAHMRSDGRGDEIICTDAKPILDYILHDRLIKPLQSVKGSRLFALFDCSHSETLLDLQKGSGPNSYSRVWITSPGQLFKAIAITIVKLLKLYKLAREKHSNVTPPPRRLSPEWHSPPLFKTKEVGELSVICLSACRDGQHAHDDAERELTFTKCFMDAAAAQPDITWTELRDRLKGFVSEIRRRYEEVSSQDDSFESDFVRETWLQEPRYSISPHIDLIRRTCL